MAYEVEVKVRVANSELLRQRLEKESDTQGRAYTKNDQYYRIVLGNGGHQDIRVRHLGDGSAIVTLKTKTMENGVEINDEQEFTATPPGPVLAMLSKLGATLYVSKTKIGWSYIRDGFIYDLSDVPPLGSFLEVERLVETKAEVPEATAQVRRELLRLGFGTGDVEERPYTAMLLELKKGARG